MMTLPPARIRGLLCGLLLVFGLLNVVVRVPGTSISLYYLVAPVFLVGLAYLSVSTTKRLLLIFLVVGCGWAAGLVHQTPISSMAAQSVFYLLAFTAVESIRWWKTVDTKLVRFRRLLDMVFLVVLLICIAQIIFDFDIPGTWGYRQYGYATAFYFTPNDLALFLCGYLFVALFDDVSWMKKAAVLVAIVAIFLVNDAKAALIVCFVAATTFLVCPLLERLTVRRPAAVFVLIPILAGPAIFTLAVLARQNDALMMWEAVQRIATLDPFRMPGSVYNRADALIFSIQELSESWWLGLGPGGSVHILTWPQYNAFSAQSLHNAIVELMVDLGPVFLILFVAWYAKELYLLLRAKTLTLPQLRWFAFLLSAAPLSVIQSSGYISNYGFWAVATYVWLQRRSADSVRGAPKDLRAIAVTLS
jgi:hypothetical protein